MNAMAAPLRIGVVQAECDMGDLAEAFQGVSSGMMLTADERALCRENLRFFTEASRTGTCTGVIGG